MLERIQSWTDTVNAPEKYCRSLVLKADSLCVPFTAVISIFKVRGRHAPITPATTSTNGVEEDFSSFPAS